MLFGNAPISTTELLQIVTSEVPTRAKSDRNTDWTQAVKEVLCEAGQERGFKIYASIRRGLEKHEEWLLDVVWWTVSGGMQLGVESEWGKVEHVLDDFEKLMSVKSPLKLVLFKSANTGLSTEKLVRELEGYLAGCGKTRFEADAVPRNSLVSTVQPDKKKACEETTSSSWMCSAT